MRHIWVPRSQASQGHTEVTLEVPRQPELHNESLSQKIKKKNHITLYPEIAAITCQYAIKNNKNNKTQAANGGEKGTSLT